MANKARGETEVAALASGRGGGPEGQRMPPEEFLERNGVTQYMKDVVTLLLENRPEKPLEFIVQYLDEICDGANPLVHSYHMLQLTQRNPARLAAPPPFFFSRAVLKESEKMTL